MQLLIEILQDKVKRLEGKGKMEEEERVGGGDQHPPPQKERDWGNHNRMDGNRRYGGYKGGQMGWKLRTQPKVVASVIYAPPRPSEQHGTVTWAVTK